MLRCWETPRGCFKLRYPDDVCFYIEPHSWTVWATWPDSLDRSYAAGYLTGPVLGFVLRLRGALCLHASAVLLGDRAVVFVGPSGAGKSTLAAALAHRDHAVLTDDVAVLAESGGVVSVQPGYPRLRLYDDAVRLVGRQPEDFPILARGWDKRFLELDRERLVFRKRPARVAALFLLRRGVAGDPAVQSRDLTGAEAVKSIVANTFSNYLLDRRMRAEEFEAVGRLARAIPVRELSLRRTGAGPEVAAEWIERHGLA